MTTFHIDEFHRCTYLSKKYMDIKWRLATLVTMLDIACYIFLVTSGEFPINGSFYLIDDGYGQVWYVLHIH
jgi:hypothetical protein